MLFAEMDACVETTTIEYLYLISFYGRMVEKETKKLFVLEIGMDSDIFFRNI